jgi:hypothetical protein
MNDDYLTLRLPAELAEALAKWARKHRLPKSHAVREAMALYLALPGSPTGRARGLTARELRARWSTLPRLDSSEAAHFADDIAAGRESLPGVRPAWE